MSALQKYKARALQAEKERDMWRARALQAEKERDTWRARALALKAWATVPIGDVAGLDSAAARLAEVWPKGAEEEEE